MKKIVKIVGIMIMLVMILSNCIYAAQADLITGMNPDTTPWGTDSANRGIIGNVFSMALGVVQTIGMVVMVVSIVILGIRYMVSSVADKATIKQQIMPAVIGGVIMISAAGILRLIANFTAQAL